jgi:hypothetical protein
VSREGDDEAETEEPDDDPEYEDPRSAEDGCADEPEYDEPEREYEPLSVERDGPEYDPLLLAWPEEPEEPAPREDLAVGVSFPDLPPDAGPPAEEGLAEADFSPPAVAECGWW